MPGRFIVQNDYHGRRLDRIVRRLLPEVGLGRIYHLIRIGAVKLNAKAAEPSTRVAEGDEISLPVDRPPVRPGAAGRLQQRAPQPRRTGKAADLEVPYAEDIQKIILRENRDLIVLDKPIGALVHGRGSLESAVRDYLSQRIPPSLSFRPGPLHRLDRNTSGILVFSKSLKGAQIFSRLLREGKIEKYYLALMDGSIRRPEVWTDRLERDSGSRKTAVSETPAAFGTPAASPAGGAGARTVVRPIAAADAATLALLRIHTGKTHQIRSQAAHRGHPLTGDRKYGGNPVLAVYVLHAAGLRIAPGEPDALLKPLYAPLPTPSRHAVATFLGDEALDRAESAIRAALSA